VQLYPTHECWRLYEPVGLPGEDTRVELPDPEKVTSLYLKELTSFVDREIYPQVAQIETKITGNGETPTLVNQLGLLYARYGIPDRAEREFSKALELDSEFVPALVNMGNLQFMIKGAREALPYYNKAYRLSPDNPTVLLCVAKANHEIENYGSVNEAFERLKQIKPELARRFAYLEMRGVEAERAAAIGNLKEELVWAE
jgi:tetratricopeptide (TPR) repeat protein